jgi:hypothetical protein
MIWLSEYFDFLISPPLKTNRHLYFQPVHKKGKSTHGGRDPEEGSGQIAVKKTDLAVSVVAEGRFAMKKIAKTLGVSRYNLIERVISVQEDGRESDKI